MANSSSSYPHKEHFETFRKLVIADKGQCEEWNDPSRVYVSTYSLVLCMPSNNTYRHAIDPPTKVYATPSGGDLNKNGQSPHRYTHNRFKIEAMHIGLSENVVPLGDDIPSSKDKVLVAFPSRRWGEIEITEEYSTHVIPAKECDETYHFDWIKVSNEEFELTKEVSSRLGGMHDCDCNAIESSNICIYHRMPYIIIYYTDIGDVSDGTAVSRLRSGPDYLWRALDSHANDSRSGMRQRRGIGKCLHVSKLHLAAHSQVHSLILLYSRLLFGREKSLHSWKILCI